MDTTPAPRTFQESYERGTPPWVLDGPQPAVVDIADEVAGTVLDVGCGAGEHTILLASRGVDVLGVDAAPAAVALARSRADAAGVPARFAVADVFDLGAAVDLPVDTVLDSAVLHVFSPADRERYAAALAEAVRPGGTVHVLVLAVADHSSGPMMTEDEVRGSFAGPQWSLEVLERSVYRARANAEDAARLGLSGAGLHDFPAWRARVRRT